MCALSVDVFVRGRWVHLGALWWTYDSFREAWSIGVRPVGRRVRCLESAFIGKHPRFLRFVRVRWVHWCPPWGSPGSFGVFEFIWVSPGGRRVRPVSLVALGCALGVVWSVRVY